MGQRLDVSLFGDEEYEYTDQEIANLKVVLAYRQATIEDRHLFLAPGFRRRRVGLTHINDLWPPDSAFVAPPSSPGGDPVSGGMDATSIRDRKNQFLHLTAKGNIVWGYFEVKGTHSGNIAGLPATGHKVDLYETAMWRVKDGLITDAWYFGDELGLLLSLKANVEVAGAPPANTGS